ncbi:cytochrome c biogenesis CcdA family protein [Paenibacillus sp. JDR-2]|uniref:cytochrome c biogenesis CcdA family protein n=1 Tax=Paenibacillus sp. (strain JDR-2) TaxID=324057 RepID=UPI000166AD7A|nr:cytochrome c biogenesis protein CcdA [Paenibacillus sp. JDR-2]ACT04638.1 cytochrome c biogenesis protein transmembrane region [Paenibacillus sp. JDR-2]
MDILLAFSAGLLSFLSPCVLPLIPVYLSYIAGTSATDLKNSPNKLTVISQTVLFILGFSILFVLLGISVSTVSRLLSEHMRLVQQIGGALIVVFGLHMTGLLRIKLLYSEKRYLPSGSPGKKAGALVLGMAFAVGWTPCIGPILSSILIYAGSMATLGKGVLLLSMYALGLAVPFLLSAVLIDNLTAYLRKVTKHLPKISVASGVVMMLMGVLVFTNQLEVFSKYAGLIQL